MLILLPLQSEWGMVYPLMIPYSDTDMLGEDFEEPIDTETILDPEAAVNTLDDKPQDAKVSPNIAHRP